MIHATYLKARRMASSLQAKKEILSDSKSRCCPRISWSAICARTRNQTICSQPLARYFRVFQYLAQPLLCRRVPNIFIGTLHANFVIPQS